MKNINNTSKWLIVIGMLSSGIISCQKSTNDFVPVKTEQKDEVQKNETSKLYKTTGGSTNYSETYKLISFTGKKIAMPKNLAPYLDVLYQFDWSAVGEKDLAYYQLEEKLSNASTWGGTGIRFRTSTPTDSLTYHSTQRGYSSCAQSYTYLVRLKITLSDSSVTYSNNYQFTYNHPSNRTCGW